jgi:hypothetical protein
MARRVLVASWLVVGAGPAGAAAEAGWVSQSASLVELVRVAEDGIQPQAVVDAADTLHLIYFRGRPEAGDIFYTRRAPGAAGFEAAIRVNTGREGSAVAIGTIRGAHLSVGKGGRAHVTWLGSGRAEQAQVAGKPVTPVMYARLDDAGKTFEPERNLLTWAAGLDGGGSVAADAAGSVHVTWHAGHDPKLGEAGRAVFVRRSVDEGRTFAPEARVNAEPTGACGCCGMRALVDGEGRLCLLYRGASEPTRRGMQWLVGGADGRDGFRGIELDVWRTPACPMSSAALALGRRGVLAGWEHENRVYFAQLDPASVKRTDPIPAPRSGDGAQKHPALAQNAKGEILVAWTEGTGWNKGGGLAWQVYTAEGQPVGGLTRKDGVPRWSFISAVALPDNRFAIFY